MIGIGDPELITLARDKTFTADLPLPELWEYQKRPNGNQGSAEQISGLFKSDAGTSSRRPWNHSPVMAKTKTDDSPIVTTDGTKTKTFNFQAVSSNAESRTPRAPRKRLVTKKWTRQQ